MRLVGDFYDSNVFVENDFIVDAGVAPSEVELKGALFLTHGHFDHAYFAVDYAKKFNLKIYASEKIKEYLSDPKKNYSTDFNCPPLKIDDFSAFIFLNGDGEVKIGDLSVKYFSLGGHSKSDMCFLVKDDLYVGDLVIGRGIGRMDLYGGDRAEMIKSLKKLSTLPYKTLHSGHGEDLDKAVADKVIKTYLRFLER